MSALGRNPSLAHCEAWGRRASETRDVGRVSQRGLGPPDQVRGRAPAGSIALYALFDDCCAILSLRSGDQRDATLSLGFSAGVFGATSFSAASTLPSFL